MYNVFSLSVENSAGERLELTNNHRCYDVISVEGLMPPQATIDMIDIAGSDGTLFNNSKLPPRNIVITLKIKRPIEKNRLNLYNFFKIKQWIKIYYKSRSRNVFIEGYTENFENNIFDPQQRPQISIICPDPYFKECNDSVFELSNVISAFEFPFSIDKKGREFSKISEGSRANVFVNSVQTGGLIEVIANENIHNLIVQNITTNERFVILTDFLIGDKVVINTNFGKKSATLIRSGEETNLLSKKYIVSTWFQFVPGKNEIVCRSSGGYVDVTGNITITQKYEGV